MPVNDSYGARGTVPQAADFRRSLRIQEGPTETQPGSPGRAGVRLILAGFVERPDDEPHSTGASEAALCDPAFKTTLQGTCRCRSLSVEVKCISLMRTTRRHPMSDWQRCMPTGAARWLFALKLIADLPMTRRLQREKEPPFARSLSNDTGQSGVGGSCRGYRSYSTRCPDMF
jgi:hypothetical protein